MYAIAPKCYFIVDNHGQSTAKNKGLNMKRNKLNSDSYKSVLNDKVIIKGTNVGFHFKNNQMTKLEITKNALTPTHNKMVCLDNNSCAPIIYGLTKENYVVE
jgi:hypothetical protein